MATIKQIKTLIAQAHKKATSRVESLETQKDNPTVADLYHSAAAEVWLLEDIKLALEGRPFNLDQRGQ